MKARVHDVETNYEVDGQGKPIVFIHGMGLNLSLWEEYRNAMSRNHCIVCYDIYGHGESGAPDKPWSFALFADQLAGLLDHIGVEKALVVGFSLGGLIAQRFAIDYKHRVSGLVIVGSVSCRLPEEQRTVEERCKVVAKNGPTAVADGTISRWFTSDFKVRHPAVVERWKRQLLSNRHERYARAYDLFTIADTEFRDRLSEIEAPALIVTGDEDVGQSPRMAREMARRIPNSRVLIAPDVAHMYPVEAAGSLISMISRFSQECIFDDPA